MNILSVIKDSVFIVLLVVLVVLVTMTEIRVVRLEQQVFELKHGIK